MGNSERKALGKGFGALLKNSGDDKSKGVSAEKVLELSLGHIITNPEQPRKEFDQQKIHELAESIKTKGVIQPILVRKAEEKEGHFELIAGERRYRASRLAGRETIPAIVKDLQDHELLEIALIENIQRQDLNPIEEAKAYQALLFEHAYTQEDLARRVGKNRSTIANMIRLLQLSESVQKDLSEGRISAGHARTLLAVESDDLREKLKDRIIREDLSVRAAEKMVKQQEQGADNEKKDTKLTAQMTQNQNRLCEKFGTKVAVAPNGEKGKIVIDYYSVDDFNRIFKMLMKK